MPAIPFILIGRSHDKQTYVLVHHLPHKTMPVAVSLGEIERISCSDFEAHCREIILSSLDAFAMRSKTGPSAYDQLTDREVTAFHRTHRFVDATLRGSVVDFAPNHFEKGDLVGCEPALRLKLERIADNSSFMQTLETAFSRCTR